VRCEVITHVSEVLAFMHEIVAEAERVFVEFLKAQLALCFTFVDLVKTELIMDGQAAESVIKKAEDGYANVARLLPRVQSVHLRDEITVTLAGLRVRLDGERTILQNRLNVKS
jgi:hypothetical protein